jgi:RNA polymerase sigma-70 factor (ECF subfamily)
MLYRRDVAEEVPQDAFLRIWLEAPGFAASRGTPMSWMTAVVRNAALDRLRRQRRELPLEDLPSYEAGLTRIAILRADSRHGRRPNPGGLSRRS